MALHGKKTLLTLQQGIDNKTDFNVGNVAGYATNGKPGYVRSYGRMPEFDADSLRQLDKCEELAYVVTSYATPIAWCDINGVWTIPTTKYSATTTGHQGRVAVAAHNPGFWDRVSR